LIIVGFNLVFVRSLIDPKPTRCLLSQEDGQSIVVPSSSPAFALSGGNTGMIITYPLHNVQLFSSFFNVFRLCSEIVFDDLQEEGVLATCVGSNGTRCNASFALLQIDPNNGSISVVTRHAVPDVCYLAGLGIDGSNNIHWIGLQGSQINLYQVNVGGSSIEIGLTAQWNPDLFADWQTFRGFSLVSESSFLLTFAVRDRSSTYGSSMIYLLSANGTVINSKEYSTEFAPILFYSAPTDQTYALYSSSNSQLAVAKYNLDDLSYENTLPIAGTLLPSRPVYPTVYGNNIFVNLVNLPGGDNLSQILLDDQGNPYASNNITIGLFNNDVTEIAVTKGLIMIFEYTTDESAQPEFCIYSYNSTASQLK